ncbi:MAG: hypothetical protein IT329_13560 [Caldilineaceae bacterium]|nr:hypothetical protein [Caldilineaceae bacterium]
MRRLVFVLTLALVLLASYTIQAGRRPDVRLISLAVRATVFAMPTPTAHIVEVTRVVEVTRIVEVTHWREAAPTPALTATATATLTPTDTPVAAAPAAAVAALAASAAPAVSNEFAASAMAQKAAPNLSPEALAADVPPTLPPTETPAPVPQTGDAGCPATSANQYSAIPVGGPASDRPDSLHGDLNLALRGYVPFDAALSLVDINGPADGDAPQLAAVVDGRAPVFTRAFRVRDWNWNCGGDGCRGDELQTVEVSLLAIQTTPGETLRIPTRGAEIYGGGFKALVVYADPQRLTLVYTREDTVANGYSVHLEGFCVDPNLLAAYQTGNAGGRGSLPGLHNGDPVGTARYSQVLVAVRDRGSFTDPRSRKDWWRGY